MPHILRKPDFLTWQNFSKDSNLLIYFSEPAPKEESPQPVLPAGAVTKSSYVPPHLRNSSARSVRGPESMDGPQVGPTPGGPRGTRRPKHAPDISNEVYFPSLSAAMGTDDPAYKTGQTNR